MATYSMRYGAYTEKGRGKEYNQDHYFCAALESGDKITGLFAVADGVGGLSRGEVASGLACRELGAWWESNKQRDTSGYLQEMAALPDLAGRINRLILSAGKEYGSGMGTTLSLLAVCGNSALVIHIGDSRIYRVRKGFLGRQDKVEQLTQDDSTKVLRQDRSGNPFYKEVLTACLGMCEPIDPHILQLDLRRGDRFILCSDGLYKKNPDTAMLRRLLSRYSEEDSGYCLHTVEAVRQQGETDDITMVYAAVE